MKKTLYNLAVIALILCLLPFNVRAAIELESYAVLRNDADLVHYMRLESATATVGSNMTNNNSVTFISGQFNNAGHFLRASNQSLYLASDLGIGAGAITLCSWVKITTQPANDTRFGIQGKDDGGLFVRYMIQYDDTGGTDRVRFLRNRTGVADGGYSVNQTLTTDTWYHICMTYDTTNIQGYLDGATLGSATAASGNGSASAHDCYAIGAHCNDDGGGDGTNVDSRANADIDDAAVFDRALTSTEIADYYAATAAAGSSFISFE